MVREAGKEGGSERERENQGQGSGGGVGERFRHAALT